MNERNIIHMDLDTFFVSVERLLHPELAKRPLIVGGGHRGVVAACSYETRRFGVHSAMPMKQALQRCPDAVVISGDMEAYSKYSKMVTEVISEGAPAFEKASIDEFYIDASGMDKFFGAFKWATELQQKVVKETGLPISMAMSINKTVSKISTAEFKPRAQKLIPAGTELEFLGPLGVEKMPGIGPQTAMFLRDMGVRDLETLRKMQVKYLVGALGKNGLSIWNKANGRDPTPVIQYSEEKSISTESTFHDDTMDVKRLKSLLIAMVEKVAFKLREKKKLTSCITVKIRYSNFDTETKQLNIPYSSADHVLLKVVIELFEKLYTRRMLLRLVGVRFSGLVHGNHQIDLFSDTTESISLYDRIDHIKHRFGSDKIMRATTLDVSGRVKTDLNMFKG